MPGNAGSSFLTSSRDPANSLAADFAHNMRGRFATRQNHRRGEVRLGSIAKLRTVSPIQLFGQSNLAVDPRIRAHGARARSSGTLARSRGKVRLHFGRIEQLAQWRLEI